MQAMANIKIRFYGELNDFLPMPQRQLCLCHPISGCPTVKEVIEALGVPHTEVELVLVDGVSADFGRQLQDGELVSVYPSFRSFDISPLTRVMPEPLSEIRFVLDVHLGKLAAFLRMAGFDSAYRTDASDEQLAEISSAERRILLTFDRGLLKRRNVAYGYCVRSREPQEQFREVIRRFGLENRLRPFTRCMTCNGVLEPVPREKVFDRLPEKVKGFAVEFTACSSCGRIYWKGSHYEKMVKFIEKAISS
jgi:hypothetical protein